MNNFARRSHLSSPPVVSRRSAVVLKIVALSVTAAMFAAGCSDGSEPTIPRPEVTPASPTPSVRGGPNTTVAAVADSAATAWTELVAAAAQLSVDPSQQDTVEARATPEVAAQLAEIFREGFDNEVISFAVETDSSATQTTIADCTVLARPLATSRSVWWSATVAQTERGWVVEDFAVESMIGCAPAAIATDVFAAYDQYWAARDPILNPPDPSAAALDDVTTGEHRETLRGLAERLLVEAAVIRGEPGRHPEFFQINGVDEVVLLDCQQTDPDRGAYDAVTGERSNLIEAIVPDQRDALQVTMRRDDDKWKVASVQAQRNFSCDFAPTTRGIPVVPLDTTQ